MKRYLRATTDDVNTNLDDYKLSNGRSVKEILDAYNTYYYPEALIRACAGLSPAQAVIFAKISARYFKAPRTFTHNDVEVAVERYLDVSGYTWDNIAFSGARRSRLFDEVEDVLKSKGYLVSHDYVSTGMGGQYEWVMYWESPNVSSYSSRPDWWYPSKDIYPSK